MIVSMDARALAVACSRMARKTDEYNKLIDANRKALALMGYPDLLAVLEAIDAEERVKPPAVMPDQKA